MYQSLAACAWLMTAEEEFGFVFKAVFYFTWCISYNFGYEALIIFINWDNV